MPKYTIKEGYEHVVIAQEGVRRLSRTEVESDYELNNPILIPVEAAPAQVQQQPQASNAPAAPAVAPAQPVTPPAAPAAPVQTPTQEGAK